MKKDPPWGHKTCTYFSTNNEDKRLKLEFMFHKDNEEEVYLELVEAFPF